MVVAPLVLAAALALQDSARAGEALRVFLDCPTGGCDQEYFRTEIRFVNYVRDRTVADIHALVTRQEAGGGTEYTLTFIGLRALAGLTDTLHYVSSSTDTEDERRAGVAQVLRLGLVRYVARTPLARRLGVRYDAPDEDDAPRGGHDPWNFWVFEISGSADVNGQESERSHSFSGSLEARRVTEQWKWSFELDGGVSRTRFQLDDTTTFTRRRNNWSLDGLGVRSLGQHWSAGALLEVVHTSFRNVDLQVRSGPAIEFNVFPYRESTRRILTAQYAAGFEYSRYQDTTIYGLLRETRPLHNLEINLEVRQPWGSTDASLDFTQYLHDLSKANLGLNASASIRLVRGLELDVYGGYRIVRSQLYLPKAGATPQEIIAQQRALATNYEYYSGFGLSFTFGSIYNNIVNPRF